MGRLRLAGGTLYPFEKYTSSRVNMPCSVLERAGEVLQHREHTNYLNEIADRAGRVPPQQEINYLLAEAITKGKLTL